MRWVLFGLGAITGLAGYGILGNAETIFHEMMAGTMFICSAVFISGAGIVEAIERTSKDWLRALHAKRDKRIITSNKGDNRNS